MNWNGTQWKIWMAVQKNVLAKLPYHLNKYVGAIDSKAKLWDKKKQRCNRCLFAFVDIQTQASSGDKKGIVKSGFI